MTIVAHNTDSDLGRWTFNEWRPAAGDALAWAIERVWFFEGTTAHRRERVLPTGIVEVIVQLDGRYHDIESVGPVLTPVSCVSGVQTGPFVIEAPAHSVCVLGLRLHPIGAWLLFRRPVTELAPKSIDLDDVLGSASRELAERCADAGTAQERVRVAVQWVAERIGRSFAIERPDSGVRWAAARIIDTRGAVVIRRLHEEVGTSAARFTTVFQDQVGLTPKRFARIHRFRYAISLLQRGGSSLSAVAHIAGYYDQPHMNADFRAMAGMTPRTWLESTHYPDSPNLAESVS